MPDLPAPPPRPDEPDRLDPKLAAMAGATPIHEPSAAERGAGRRIVHTTPEEQGMSDREIRMGFLFSAAVARLGGAFVLSEEECRDHYSLMEDFAFNAETGGVRFWSVKAEQEA